MAPFKSYYKIILGTSQIHHVHAVPVSWDVLKACNYFFWRFRYSNL